MIYPNNSQSAILELERQRTGNYGKDYGYGTDSSSCVRCGMNAEYEIDGQCYCKECLSEELLLLMQGLIADGDLRESGMTVAARAILTDCINESDLDCYTENYFREHRLEGEDFYA